MSTDALALPRLRDLDNPWRRLPWTLPAALLIWAGILWAFAVFTEEPRHRLPESRPVDAQVIELPPEPPAPIPPKAEPKPRPAPVKPAAAAKPRPAEPVRIPRPKALPPQLQPTPAAKTEPAPATEPAPPAPAPPPPRPAAPAPEKAPAGGRLSASGGAQAIVRPMPQIPDDLREEALHVVALARFHVAADGSATVELAKPTPNPRLNRLLLETLKNWKFFPAMKDGMPVASTEEITIRIDVK